MEEKALPQKKKVEVVVLFHHGFSFVDPLFDSLKNQVTDFECSYSCLVTPSGDGTEKHLESRGIPYQVIADFNHGLTREKAIMASSADVVVLLTQDVYFEVPNALQCLVDCLDGDVKYAYLRQICKNWSIERYTRKVNYPKVSEVRDESCIPSKGLDAFFASDACSAYNVAYFKKIGGYDGKALPSNEDMYYARKVLLGGKKVEYCAASYVIHSHKFTLKQLYHRYELVGRFFKENPEFQAYPSARSGMKLAWKVLGRILLNFNIPALVMFIPNMVARYLGKRHGERS